MGKIFKYREYDCDVEKLLNAIHSWLINTNSINLKKDFQVTVRQGGWISKEGVDGYE